MPTVTGADTYSVSIQASKAGYVTKTITKTVIVGQQENTTGNLVLSATSGTLTYPTTKTFTVNTNASGGALSVTSSNEAVATASISGTTVTITPKAITTDGQTTTITVTSAATANYEAQTATYTATVNRGTITLEATVYTGGYDGSAHDIVTITKKTPSDVTIKYALNGVDKGTTIPQVTDIGTYSVTITASKAGYVTKTITKTTTLSNDATEMFEVGDYVQYTPTTKSFTMTTAQTGYSSDQTFSTGDYTGLWRVLYNDSTNGLQLISADSVGYLYLSGTNGYNNVVTTLNSFSSNYVNSYASSGRSVGTSPTSPSTDTSSTVSLVFNTSTGLKAADTRYTTDLAAMQSASMQDIDGYYWLPSRYVFSTSDVGYFGIYTISADGAAEYRRVKDMYVMGTSYEYQYAYGVRPVVTLNDGIKATGGSGTSSVPYQIGN